MSRRLNLTYTPRNFLRRKRSLCDCGTIATVFMNNESICRRCADLQEYHQTREARIAARRNTQDHNFEVIAPFRLHLSEIGAMDELGGVGTIRHHRAHGVNL